MASNDFVEQEDGFADDDLISPDDFNALRISQGQPDAGKSYLERDNFENELGSAADDPFAENFGDISKHNVVDVVAEGDFVGRPVVVIYAYRLPSNKAFDHQKFLRQVEYLQHTLDKLVDMDYTIVYFHYGLRSHNKPPLKWLVQAYQVLDRRYATRKCLDTFFIFRYKKNLKALYLVHPTKFIRFVWTIFKPFISLKFERKVHYVNFLHELDKTLLSRLSLPQPILDHDQSLNAATTSHSVPGTPALPPRPTQQFNVSLQFILNHNPDSDIPPIVLDLIEFLRQYGMDVEGIFRRSAEVAAIKNLQSRIDMGEKIDFVNDPLYAGNTQKAVLEASVLLKTFLRSMGEPVITNRLYPELTHISDVKNDDKAAWVRDFVRKLPPENYLLLKTVIQFLTEVAANSKVNLMNANNLSVVFGPNLTWPTDQQVPITQLHNLNNFCYQLIINYDKIFAD
ncbi:RhoGAP domain-containing protein [Aphelenchoides avenae]|nr:RhoGAP domain-containing protein [Aphelenchus avenae]